MTFVVDLHDLHGRRSRSPFDFRLLKDENLATPVERRISNAPFRPLETLVTATLPQSNDPSNKPVDWLVSLTVSQSFWKDRIFS